MLAAMRGGGGWKKKGRADRYVGKKRRRFAKGFPKLHRGEAVREGVGFQRAIAQRKVTGEGLKENALTRGGERTGRIPLCREGVIPRIRKRFIQRPGGRELFVGKETQPSHA